MSFELKTKQRHKKPLEQLRERKRELRRLCRQEERMLKEGWEYARHNSGSLLLSGISGLLFQKRRSAEETYCSGGLFQTLWSALSPLLSRRRERCNS